MLIFLFIIFVQKKTKRKVYIVLPTYYIMFMSKQMITITKQKNINNKQMEQLIKYKRQNKLQSLMAEIISPLHSRKNFEKLGIETYNPKLSLKNKAFICLFAVSLFIPFTTSPLLLVSRRFK